ncbi:MAG: VCBS repeat-containing protein [Deltaproteobacteria bacterium]|nr:VCBS repeat-containing protein [Nannocystaceae bacterium]
MPRRIEWTALLAALPCCTQTATVADTLGSATDGTSAGIEASSGEIEGDSTASTNADESSSDAASSSGPAVIYDVGGGDEGTGDTGVVETCDVADDLDGISACDVGPYPPSFEAQVQWQWDEAAGSLSTPLVANLTDDNGDGVVDLCDTPDIVIIARLFGDMMEGDGSQTELLAFDGATGAIHWRTGKEFAFAFASTPAIGDIDGDGAAEIVAIEDEGRLIAFDGSGAVEWTSPDVFSTSSSATVALADLDADGDVEIMSGPVIADHEGHTLVTVPAPPDNPGFAVDLDDDGDLEYVHGAGAHHHDGTPYFELGGDVGHPQVADLDDDGAPEIVYSTVDGVGTRLLVLRNDGSVLVAGADDLAGLPAALHDIDGEGGVDIVVGRMQDGVAPVAGLSVIDFDDDDLIARWTAPTVGGCCASGTAFDFLGDASAEALFSDDAFMFVFDADGGVLTSVPHLSPTGYEYPVVADVDNDDSAEIVFTAEGTGQPALVVVRDADDGWVPARRIWNQHAYHVTNVREDGTIPQHQPKSWESLNTFRTQAQRGVGGVCMPEPAG